MRGKLLVCALAVTLAVFAQGASGADYTWIQTGAGPYNNTDGPNWTGGVSPGVGAAGDNVRTQIGLASAQTITNTGTWTIGNLTMGDSAGLLGQTISGGTVIFNNKGLGATLTAPACTGTNSAFRPTSLVLNDDLTVAVGVNARNKTFNMNGGYNITEDATPRKFIYNGAGNNAVLYANWDQGLFTGGMVLNGGLVRFSTRTPYMQVTCDITCNGTSSTDGRDAIQLYDANPFAPNINLTLNALTNVNMGGQFLEVGALYGTGSINANLWDGAQFTLTLNGNKTQSAADFAGVVQDGDYANTAGMFMLTKKGAYAQTFSGTADNQLCMTQVTDGVLALNKTPGINAVGETRTGNVDDGFVTYTGPNTLRIGFYETPVYDPATGNFLRLDETDTGKGEVRLLNANQILDSTALAMKGGLFNANGFSEKLGTLSVQGDVDATIRLGVGSVVLQFDNSSAQAWSGAGKLYITQWSGNVSGGGTTQVLVGSNATGLTSAQLARILINNAGGLYSAKILSSGEIVPDQLKFLPGDANQDSKVSFADYILLANNFGQGSATWQMGDFNADGKVSFADYILLANNFGQHVPEPATLGLLLIGGLGLIRRKK